MDFCRYARSIPNFNLVPFNLHKAPPSFSQYDSSFNQLGQMSQARPSLGYGPPPSPILNPYCPAGLKMTSGDVPYLQWPSAAMMYAHSYDQFRHAVFQVISSTHHLWLRVCVFQALALNHHRIIKLLSVRCITFSTIKLQINFFPSYAIYFMHYYFYPFPCIIFSIWLLCRLHLVNSR